MILGILQARTSSTRLPGKVLKPILAKPMLLHQWERLKKVTGLDQLVVATSTCPDDDAIEKLCLDQGIPVFRGSLDDVLDRFYQLAKLKNAKHVVRFTADCPLADFEMIDEMITFYKGGHFDYVSNSLERTFPHGLDAEVFSFQALELAWKEAAFRFDREHVTPFIHGQPKRFSVGQFKNKENLSSHRWTVDYPEDFELVSQIYQSLYCKNPEFKTTEILNCLKANPDIEKLNSQYKINKKAKLVVFRTDSSEKTGAGHVIRCLTLAKALASHEYQIVFACAELPAQMADEIRHAGFSIMGAEDFPRPSLLVIDQYNIGKDWEEKARIFSNKILVVDDLANRKHVCDFLLDQNLYTGETDPYSQLVSAECKKMIGPQYALIRDEFSKLRSKPKSGTKQKVLVSFGGSDQSNETLKALEGISAIKNLQVKVVAGFLNSHKSEIKKSCEEWGYEFMDQSHKIAELMAWADVAIGAGGTTTWERCCLGLPALVTILAENQERLTKTVHDFGAHQSLGWFHQTTPESYQQAYDSLTQNELQLMSKKGMDLVDGKGCSRVISCLNF